MKLRLMGAVKKRALLTFCVEQQQSPRLVSCAKSGDSIEEGKKTKHSLLNSLVNNGLDLNLGFRRGCPIPFRQFHIQECRGTPGRIIKGGKRSICGPCYSLKLGDFYEVFSGHTASRMDE